MRSNSRRKNRRPSRRDFDRLFWAPISRRAPIAWKRPWSRSDLRRTLRVQVHKTLCRVDSARKAFGLLWIGSVLHKALVKALRCGSLHLLMLNRSISVYKQGQPLIVIGQTWIRRNPKSLHVICAFVTHLTVRWVGPSELLNDALIRLRRLRVYGFFHLSRKGFHMLSRIERVH